MSSALYLAGLLVSIAGMVVLDYRFKLAFFASAWRAAVTIAVSMAVLIAWDIAGIRLGIFFSGASAYSSRLMLLPDFPIEEPVFLFFLSYLTLVIYRGARTYASLHRP